MVRFAFGWCKAAAFAAALLLPEEPDDGDEEDEDAGSQQGQEEKESHFQGRCAASGHVHLLELRALAKKEKAFIAFS